MFVGEELVLPLPEPDAEQPGDRVPRPARAARLEQRHEGPVVLSRAHREVEPARIVDCSSISGDRIPAPASVAPPRIVAVDEHDVRTGRDELVRERGADEPAADDRDVEAHRVTHRDEDDPLRGALSRRAWAAPTCVLRSTTSPRITKNQPNPVTPRTGA